MDNITNINERVYLQKLRQLQANLYDVGYSGLMRMIVESRIDKKVIEHLTRSKFKQPKTKIGVASSKQLEQILSYGVKAYGINYVEAYCLIRALQAAYGIKFTEPRNGKPSYSSNSGVVPSGKHAGKMKEEVPQSYINTVCDQNSKYFSLKLSKFFAGSAEGGIVYRFGEQIEVEVLPAIVKPVKELNKCNGRSKKGERIKRYKSLQ